MLDLPRIRGVMKSGRRPDTGTASIPSRPPAPSMLREAQAFLGPIAGERSAELDAAFAEHSLRRDALQAAFVFLGSAVIAGLNALIDFVFDMPETLTLNLFLCLAFMAGAYLTAHIETVERMRDVANAMAGMACVALVLTKFRLSGADWFIYFADILVIVALCSLVPTSFRVKLACALLVLGSAAVLLERAPWPDAVGFGVLLLLAGAAVLSLIGERFTRAAHYSSFLGLVREREINEALRSARQQIGSLERLLPICSYCKKVRDEAGDWSELDEYLARHAEVDLSHSICPRCFAEQHPEEGE